MNGDTVNAAEEGKLISAVKRAVDLVDSRGMTPNAAIEKVAREEKFTPGFIKLACTAYNTGRQTSQRESNKSILDKFASFELADAEAVCGSIYGKTKEASAHSDYASGPTWLPKPKAMEKAASAPCSLVEKPPEPYKPDPMHALDRAYGDRAREKRAVDEASRLHSAAGDSLRTGVAALVTYFKKFAGERMTFADAEKAASAYFGDATAKLFDVVHDRAKSREKRAGDKAAVLSSPVDLNREPLSIVAACLKAAADVNRYAAELKGATEKAASADKERFASFSQAGVPKGPEKSAGILSTPAMGTMVGSMLGRSLGSAAPKEQGQMVDDTWMDLESPEHQNELRKIRVHAMLNGMMTDPDDPISGYDPDQVLTAYNELAQLGPRTAEQSAAIKPLLRKRLAGQMEPFEAKEVTDIEKGVAATRMNTPNTSILSDAPDKLFG